MLRRLMFGLLVAGTVAGCRTCDCPYDYTGPVVDSGHYGGYRAGSGSTGGVVSGTLESIPAPSPQPMPPPEQTPPAQDERPMIPDDAPTLRGEEPMEQPQTTRTYPARPVSVMKRPRTLLGR